MADGSNLASFAARPPGKALTLSDLLMTGRPLMARCVVPACGRRAPCDPTPWLAEGLGGAPLAAFAERLRCVCGGRRARLEVCSDPIAPSPRHDLFVFR